MMKIVGKVTEEEKEEILELFEKRIALENLINVIDVSNENMYNKLVSDYGKIMVKFNDWWNNNKIKYDWKDESLRINFETNEIIYDE